MRKINEIRADLKAQVDAVKALDPAKDADALKKGMAAIETLTQELEDANKIEAAEQLAADQKLAGLQEQAGRSFSLLKFFRELSEPNGQLTGLEAKVCKMGAEEYDRLGLQRKGYVVPSAFLRDSAGQNATTDADGGYMKVQSGMRYIDAVKDRLVIAALGATVLGDLVGTVPIVRAGEITAAWKAEGASASVSKSTIARVNLTPHRNAVIGAFSKDLLHQTSLDVEKIIMDKVINAHATLIDKAAIAGTGSSNEPTGILANCTADNGNLVAIDTTGGALTWAKVVELETKVNSNNGNRGKLAYLTNAKVIGAMKTTERTSTNGRYLLDGDFKIANGYAIDWTNLVPSNLTKSTGSNLSAMIFGNFEDLYVGHWGGVDIVVDPYTLAANGDVRFVLNSWDDVAVVEPKSFAAIKDIIA